MALIPVKILRPKNATVKNSTALFAILSSDSSKSVFGGNCWFIISLFSCESHAYTTTKNRTCKYILDHNKKTLRKKGFACQSVTSPARKKDNLIHDCFLYFS